MTRDFRRTLEENWSMLAIARLSSPTAMRVADLPVSTVYGLVAAGVDPEGHRHLLVPIDPRQSVRRGFDGPVIRLARRPLETAVSYQVYADLTCLDPEFDDVFATFCAAALEEIGVSQRRPVKGLYRALDRWKALFQRSGTLLGPEQLAGLYAELLVLRRLLEVNPSAHQWWTGPTGYRHDFASDAVALEVKASLRSDRRRVRVHGLDQLDPPAGGELLLPWFCLEPAEEGASLPGLISEILELIDDEGPVCGLLSLVGYRPADADQYRDKRLRVVDERWYAVDGNFPRLTSDMLNEAGVAVAVQEVEYTIDLSGEAPTPLSEGEVTQCLQRMARESE